MVIEPKKEDFKMGNSNTTDHREVFDSQRKIVAHMTSKSWKKVPHVSYIYQPDITDFYAEYRKIAGKDRITINTIMLKVIAEGLLSAPTLNAHLEYNDETKKGQLQYKKDINISIPWQMPNGTMFPLAIHKVNELSLTEIAESIARLGEKVEKTDLTELVGMLVKETPSSTTNGGLTVEDIKGGTVTVSNVGSLYKEQKGHFSLLEIIPPEVFVVGIGAIQEIAGVYSDENGSKQIGIRKVLPMTLVFDHRAVDFSALVPFLKKLDEIFAFPSVINKW